MSDDDWDKEPVVPVVQASKWDDEDADQVTESWEQLDEEPKEAVAVPKVSKKKTLEQKIAERKQKEEEKKTTPDPFEFETPMERKSRLAKSVMESDFENAKALLGDLAVSSNNLDAMNPSTKKDFEEYIKLFSKKATSFEGNQHYAFFVEALTRALVGPLSLEDTRRVSSMLTAVINEKQKASRATKKKPPKKQVTVDVGMDYGQDNYDDFDDFM